jgi:hypothetical protein
MLVGMRDEGDAMTLTQPAQLMEGPVAIAREQRERKARGHEQN